MLNELFGPSREDELQGEIQLINASRYQQANSIRWLIERIETLEKRVSELERAPKEPRE